MFESQKPDRSPTSDNDQGVAWSTQVLEGLRYLGVWSLIGAGVLLTGALSARGISIIRQIDGKPPDLFPDYYLPALVIFALAGGVTVGLLFLSWKIAQPGGFGWGMGVFVLVIALFAIFVWPTPFKYYRTQANPLVLLRVTRATGHGAIIPLAPMPSVPQRSAEKP
jgi:hypothetical protein